VLKKFALYSLCLAFLATFTLVYSQQQKTPPSSTDSLATKQRAETLKKDHLVQVMSQIGVQVSDLNSNAASTSAYRQLNITLSTPDKPQTTPEEELRSTITALTDAQVSITVRGIPSNKAVITVRPP
jgi:hypothetical protein